MTLYVQRKLKTDQFITEFPLKKIDLCITKSKHKHVFKIQYTEKQPKPIILYTVFPITR